MATLTSTTSLNSDYAPIGVLELSNKNPNPNPNPHPHSASSTWSHPSPLFLSSPASISGLRMPTRAVVAALAVVLLIVASFGLTPRIAENKVPSGGIGFPPTHAVRPAPVQAAIPVTVEHAFNGVLPAVNVNAPIVRGCLSPGHLVSSCECASAAATVRATSIVNGMSACSCAFANPAAVRTPVQWTMSLQCMAVAHFGRTVENTRLSG